jgi:hypothetical protein
VTHRRRSPGTESGATPTTTPTAVGSQQYIAGLRRRRAATYRVPRLECGSCADPWTCRCYDDPEPTPRMVDAYRDAVQTISGAGMTPAAFVPEMRAMWRRGGEYRRLAQTIAERWQVAV